MSTPLQIIIVDEYGNLFILKSGGFVVHLLREDTAYNSTRNASDTCHLSCLNKSCHYGSRVHVRLIDFLPDDFPVMNRKAIYGFLRLRTQARE
jgi:hypothetical protein